ncbi:MAG: glycosyltransferase [Methanobacterium sp. Maddingley MBC34]|nr:MAG: glycosyltransferase [Methanobacterium sp. Maddingley MBC34]
MNVLSIGSDRTLLNDDTSGSTRERMIRISKNISSLHIAVFANNSENYRKLKISQKITVYAVPQGKIPFLKPYRICSDICKENNIDVVSTQDPFMNGLIGYLLKLRYKIPLNIQVHSDYIDNKWWLSQGSSHKVWNILSKAILKRADSVRTVNSSLAKRLQNFGIPEDKIINFPIFLDVEKFNLDNESTNKNNLPDLGDFEKVVLFVGSLIPTKGVDTLLKAAPVVLEKIPKTLFLIVGDGPEKNRLESLSNDLNISENIIFTGKVPFENISIYYKKSDLLVLPSRSEAWGRVVLEALVSGKPVVVSNSCKISDVILKEDCGALFEVDNPPSLAKEIVLMLVDRKNAMKMGSKGKNMVITNYSPSKIIPKYQEMWEMAIKGAKN